MTDKSNSPKAKEHSIETEGKTVYYTQATIDKWDQKLLNLNENNRAFIKYSLEDADDILKLLGSEKNLLNYTAKDLDELVFLWNNKKISFNHINEEQFVGAIGAAFGHYLNMEVGTVWEIVSDEYGTDYSCISKTIVFQLFPFSSVWKALEQNREDSLNGIVLLVKEKMDSWDKR